MPDPTPWLVQYDGVTEARLRLFCFPYVGGGASAYRTWRGALPDTAAIHAVQLPGRETRLREKAISRMDDLLPPLFAALEPYLDTPFAFWGHSMGALISFALARHIRQQRALLPRALFLSARRAPQLPPRTAPTHDLPRPAFLEELRQLGGTPEAVLQNEGLMALLLPILRADFELVETYRYQPAAPLACPIIVYGGADDDTVPQADLAQWQIHTTNTFEVKVFEGDHFYLRTQERALLAELGQQLTRLMV